MKRVLTIAILIATSNLLADCPLPENRSETNKELTVPVELSMKRAQSYINANKPLAATTELKDAENNLSRIKTEITRDLHKTITDCIEQMKYVIKLQKEYQIKQNGKLNELN